VTAPQQAVPREPWFWLARIRRPQGRKGEVLAEILTDFPEKFAQRRNLWLISPQAPDAPPHAVSLLAHWPHKGAIVLHFAGIDSISAAQSLTGLIVAIPRAQRAVLTDDEVYIADLIGCSLIDVAAPVARTIGVIEDVDCTAGPVPLLIVRSAAEEILIPFAKSYLRHIDLEAKRVEMALPEGLASLNAPEAS
jgi:16S rRNA processing protein RimM